MVSVHTELVLVATQIAAVHHERSGFLRLATALALPHPSALEPQAMSSDLKQPPFSLEKMMLHDGALLVAAAICPRGAMLHEGSSTIDSCHSYIYEKGKENQGLPRRRLTLGGLHERS